MTGFDEVVNGVYVGSWGTTGGNAKCEGCRRSSTTGVNITVEDGEVNLCETCGAQVADRILNALKAVAVCEWTYDDEYGNFQTQCGNEVCTECGPNDMPAEYIYCPFCGGRIHTKELHDGNTTPRRRRLPDPEIAALAHSVVDYLVANVGSDCKLEAAEQLRDALTQKMFELRGITT